MTSLKKIVIIGFLPVAALALVAGWYISGRDYRTLSDGLSMRFRDRGTVTFNTLKRAVAEVEEESEESSRLLAFKDAGRALAEARRSVTTKNDLKVYAILNAYYLAYDVPAEQLHLFKESEDLLADQFKLTK